MKKTKIIKGVEFEKSENWNLCLPARSLITPVYFRGRIVRLLVTNSKTGKATYHECETRPRKLSLPECNVVVLPQGITYQTIYNNTMVHILYSSVSIINQ